MPLKMFPFANRDQFCQTGAATKKCPRLSLPGYSAFCMSFILMWATFIPLGASVTVLPFHPPWWSPFICPPRARHHLGFVVRHFPRWQRLLNQTLNRRGETTNMRTLSASAKYLTGSKCTVATKQQDAQPEKKPRS